MEPPTKQPQRPAESLLSQSTTTLLCLLPLFYASLRPTNPRLLPTTTPIYTLWPTTSTPSLQPRLPAIPNQLPATTPKHARLPTSFPRPTTKLLRALLPSPRSTNVLTSKPTGTRPGPRPSPRTITVFTPPELLTRLLPRPIPIPTSPYIWVRISRSSTVPTTAPAQGQLSRSATRIWASLWTRAGPASGPPAGTSPT